MAFPQHRPRRLRSEARFRDLVRETVLLPRHLILPLFVEEGLEKPEPISAMPGHSRWPASEVFQPAEAAFAKGVTTFLLFGVPAKKDAVGSASKDPDGVIPVALKSLRKHLPTAVLITDVCLCGYTSHGHCGVIGDQGAILNDETLQYLVEMALCHARAGADIVAPSDMMDGRVGAIRAALDLEGMLHTPILSYAAKFASAFYGPFREAAHSAPTFGDRRTYQMDSGNAREALIEMQLDFDEGADMLMVKPAGPYLDIIRLARDTFPCPIAAYQVSGEFSMIKAAGANGWIDETAAMMESLLGIRRAGADLIITYFAAEAAEILRQKA